jgi:benzoyl-CoA reductase subunit BamC
MPRIKIDHTKCTGCRHCETACSLNHVVDTVNPRRARIRVMKDGSRYYPVIAGPFVDAACTSKHFIVIGDQTYDINDLLYVEFIRPCNSFCPISRPVLPVRPMQGIHHTYS